MTESTPVAILRQHREDLLALRDVTGVGIGRDADTDEAVIQIFVRPAAAGPERRRRLQERIKGLIGPHGWKIVGMSPPEAQGRKAAGD